MHLMIVGIIMVQRILWKGGLDMKFGPIEIKDKSNRTIVLRNATPEDAEDLITYLKVTTAETPYLIREPEEVVMTQEQETAFINNCLNSDRSLMLIATLDGKHIGNCSFNPVGNYKRYRHRCEVAIALYQEFCGYGIGKIMMETVLKAAKEIGFEQAELEVISDNQNAITLYEKLGFQKYGTFPDNMKYADGHYAALLRRLPLVPPDPPHQPRAHHLPVLGGGQYEHRHGHEHGRRRFHRQAL